eukprot:394496_1
MKENLIQVEEAVITISCRKDLKTALGVSFSSNNMKSLEKLIFVKQSLQLHHLWRSYTNRQQNIIIAFAYVQAITSVTGPVGPYREALTLIKPKVNYVDNNINILATPANNAKINYLPDSSLDLILPHFADNEANDELIENVLKQIEQKNEFIFMPTDDNYNVNMFYKIMEQSNENNRNTNNSNNLYDDEFKDLFDPYNVEEQSEKEMIDVTFSGQLKTVANQKHKELIKDIANSMGFEREQVVLAYKRVQKVYGTVDLETMGGQIVNYCLGT